MKKYTNTYRNGDENYKTHMDAQNRMLRIIQDHQDIKLQRKIEGRGPLSGKFEWIIQGDEQHGYWVEETIEK